MESTSKINFLVSKNEYVWAHAIILIKDVQILFKNFIYTTNSTISKECLHLWCIYGFGLDSS